MKVLMIGSWHLGSVIGACLAEAGNEVHYWDQNPQVAARWKTGLPPIHEPGLEDLVKKHWGKNIFWTENLKDVAPKADWICLTYDTPINDQDEVQLEVVEEGFAKVLAAGITPAANFFFTAQLPVGTSRGFLGVIKKHFANWKGHVLYQPENLRLGEAIKCFIAPDRAVLGLDTLTDPARSEIVASFQKLTANTKTPLNIMSLESAEMVKHALNSFLATCVVFANEIAEISEQCGADAWDVVASLKQDSRVGPKAFLRPGLGFSGGTLARDVKTLSHLTEKIKGGPAAGPLNFFLDLYAINSRRNDWIAHRLLENLETLQGKKVVLLGVTYKPNTSTVRRSPALDIGKLLHEAGAQCVAVDPMADLQEYSDKERNFLPFKLEKDVAGAFNGADAAVLVTEWPQFKELKWAELAPKMKNKVVVDTKNHFDGALLAQAGVTHVVPGKPVTSGAKK